MAFTFSAFAGPSNTPRVLLQRLKPASPHHVRKRDVLTAGNATWVFALLLVSVFLGSNIMFVCVLILDLRGNCDINWSDFSCYFFTVLSSVVTLL